MNHRFLLNSVIDSAETVADEAVKKVISLLEQGGIF